MTKDQIPMLEIKGVMSNQVIAQRLLAQGLPTQPLDMLVLFLQFLANEVVNRLAQGASLEDCSVLMNDFARYEILRNRAVNTSVREAKARQKAATDTTEVAKPPVPTTTAAKEAPTPTVPANPPPPSATAARTVHLSRQQRRALLRKQTQLAGPPADAHNAS